MADGNAKNVLVCINMHSLTHQREYKCQPIYTYMNGCEYCKEEF